MNLNNVRSNSNDNVGGRDFNSLPDTTMVDTGVIGVYCPAISEIKKDTSLSSRLNLESQGVSQKSKRVGFLYEKAFTREALYEAYLVARKGKRKKRATLSFEKRLGAELDSLYNELQNGTYKPKPYVTFYVYEPKKREIKAPAFRDLVVQHAIYRVIYPIFDRKFIHTSYACRKGGGTHKASAYTQREIRKYSGNDYFAKLDIKKFFYSIMRFILEKMFHKVIKDKRFIAIMMMFAEIPTLFGIPIGNLLSQLYALIFLNPLDHFVKRVLKVKSYVRYVDDFVMIGLNLEKAKEFKKACEEFVIKKLGLQLSHWHIQKIKRGINYVGYRTWKKVKFVRKHSMYKMKRAIKKEKIESIISLVGHAKGTATLRYFKRLLIEFSIFHKLPQRTQICLSM